MMDGGVVDAHITAYVCRPSMNCHTHNYRSEDENVLKKETLISVALKLYIIPFTCAILIT